MALLRSSILLDSVVMSGRLPGSGVHGTPSCSSRLRQLTHILDIQVRGSLPCAIASTHLTSVNSRELMITPHSRYQLSAHITSRKVAPGSDVGQDGGDRIGSADSCGVQECLEITIAAISRMPYRLLILHPFTGPARRRRRAQKSQRDAGNVSSVTRGTVGSAAILP